MGAGIDEQKLGYIVGGRVQGAGIVFEEKGGTPIPYPATFPSQLQSKFVAPPSGVAVLCGVGGSPFATHVGGKQGKEPHSIVVVATTQQSSIIAEWGEGDFGKEEPRLPLVMEVEAGVEVVLFWRVRGWWHK